MQDNSDNFHIIQNKIFSASKEGVAFEFNFEKFKFNYSYQYRLRGIFCSSACWKLG